MLRKLLARLTPFSRAPAPHDAPAVSATETADRLIAAGNRAESSGDFREACERYREAADAAPGYAKAHLNLGIGLEAVGDADGAIKSHEAALAIDPGDAYANYNLAGLLYARGALERAGQLLRFALERKPEFPQAQVALANVYDAQGNLAAAATALEVALKQRPDYAGAWYNYAEVLRKLERPGEAEAALRRATEIDPKFVSAYSLLGSMLRGQSRIGEALEAFATARRLAPDRFDLESLELHALNLSDGISDAALFARHRAFGARLEDAEPARFAPFRNVRDPERRLRIGYVSCDFNLHPVACFALPVLERHDRSAYEVYCYSTGSRTDDITRQLRGAADVWRDAVKMSDTGLAETINRDEIDVLVDLTGHAGTLRLGMFAQQPSPVQVTWLGYLNTTGLTRIQYRLCDAYADPPGRSDQLHTETLVRLPHSQWCYRPFLSIEHATEPPFKRNGFITFGSFNHAPKLSPTVRRLWADILVRLPNSRLLAVGVPQGHARDSLLRDFQGAGVAASRITIVPRLPLDEYFRCFDAVDMALDTTPYSGGTTTCDTLWMGVPVVTVPGPRSVSRSTASILSTLGLPEWIASTPDDYVRLAVEFARDEAVLAKLRRSLRQRMRESPLMDEPRFARDIEAAYRRMWKTWCEGAAT
ncbi:MAG: tetratricopeptide repeat protein [Burkholderiales bacterium]